ncbi:MalY/PatB family protein [Methylophaga sp. OBS3]|uniref:MalY/PatB family protein n=1 Tax=Methylophaga sp. OBS3 TaxID=2991934 RepID=UPI00225B3696|nr:PatB family C-S lyase [Methylophaga sp. OBS3]MCX4190611.1 PatB family C-S lyase [Methylophaga sp. OBS3]
MSEFDFDQVITREGSGAQKYDNREVIFGLQDVIPLWVADMDFSVPPAVNKALKQRAEHPIFGYHQFPDSLYQAIQNWYLKRFNWSIDKQHILMCPGVVPSIHAVINALTQPNDGVIVQSPVYFPFFSAVTETGRQLVLNPLLKTDDGYRMNLEQLEAQAKAGAKLLLICSPHNPVGRVWQVEELQTVLAIAEQYNLVVISDEIHMDLVFKGFQNTPLTTLAKPGRVITTVSASKTFNIAGLNLSSLIVEEAAQRKAIEAEFKRWHVSSANPFSIVATQAAYQDGEAWLDALLDYLAINRDWVKDFFAKHLPLIRIQPIEGTYLLWLDCSDLNLSDKALRQFFVNDCGVAMNPGAMFGEGGSGFMRMNIAAPLSTLKQACQQILGAYQQQFTCS